MEGYTMELIDCTNTLLHTIAQKSCKRDSVALLYWAALRSSEKTDWRAVNTAIMERWSPSALNYIKEKAWKLMEGKK